MSKEEGNLLIPNLAWWVGGSQMGRRLLNEPQCDAGKGRREMSKPQSLWMALRLLQKGWHPLSPVEEEMISKRRRRDGRAGHGDGRTQACSWGWT